MTGQLQRMAESYVAVETDTDNGSGTIVAHRSRSSFILTCWHVVNEKGAAPSVVYRDGARFRRVKARIVAFDEENDLALLRTTRIPSRRPIAVAEHEPELYDVAYVMGTCAGLYGTPGQVIIAARDNTSGARSTKGLYQYTGLALQGISGGLLCNIDAELIGVPHLAEREGDRVLGNIGYAVPLPVIRDFLLEHLPVSS